jgi:hypothetical protein
LALTQDVLRRVRPGENKMKLNKIKELFTKGKKPSQSDPFVILQSSMGDICSQLIKHLSDEHYRWTENNGVKTFECLILSRFLMDHALLTTFTGKIPDIRIEFYLQMITTIFEAILKAQFSQLEATELVKNRLAIYSTIMLENSHPKCWQLLSAACTGIDYSSEEDLLTFVSSSTSLPFLLIHAQDSLKKVIMV